VVETSSDYRFGDYGALYKELLQDKDNNEEWHVWYPVDNHFPTDEELKGFKARFAAPCRCPFACNQTQLMLQHNMLLASVGHLCDGEQT